MLTITIATNLILILILSVILILTQVLTRIAIFATLTVAGYRRRQKTAVIAAAAVIMMMARTHVPVGIHHDGRRGCGRATRLHTTAHRIRIITAIICVTIVVVVMAVMRILTIIIMRLRILRRVTATETRQLDAARDCSGRFDVRIRIPKHDNSRQTYG
jgi:hypothetical protein